MCAQKLTSSQLNVPHAHGTKQKRMILKTKNRDDHKNGPVVKSVESVLRMEGSSLWWERL